MNQPRAMLSVSAEALSHNVRVIKQAMPAQKILAVVKANAYGCGAAWAAQILASEVDAFGVGYAVEAAALRASGVKKPILVLTGYYNAAGLRQIDALGCDTVLSQMMQLDYLEQTTLKAPINIWLKVDTGMHRLGIPPEDLSTAIARLEKCAQVNEIVLMTHLAGTDCDDLLGNMAQIKLFRAVTDTLPYARSVANSGAVLALSAELGFTQWVRPGIALYGVSPFDRMTGTDFNLRAVMSLTALLISIKPVLQGQAVGYGGAWTAQRDSTIGVLALGYGDDYPRSAYGLGQVLVNGVLCPIVGNVSMDMMAIDLTDVPSVALGMPVLLWGVALPVEQVAKWSHLSQYELLARMSATRLSRLC